MRWLPPALERDDLALFRDCVPRAGTTLAVGRDFLNLWMYGRAAVTADPGQFYDLATCHRAIRALRGMELSGQNGSYPPSIMLLAAPFGQLGYLAALACRTLIGVLVGADRAGLRGLFVNEAARLAEARPALKRDTIFQG